MRKLKLFTCLIIIVGIMSSSSVTAEFDRTSNVTIQNEPYLDGIKCLSVIGPNFCPLTELLFLGKLESYGGTYNRTAPVNPVIGKI